MAQSLSFEKIDLSSVVSSDEVNRMRKVMKIAYNYRLVDFFLSSCVILSLLFLLASVIYLFLWLFDWAPVIQPIALKQFFIGVGLLGLICAFSYYVTSWRRKYYYRMINDRMNALRELVEIVDSFNQNATSFSRNILSHGGNFTESHVSSTHKRLLADQKIIFEAMDLFQQEEYRDLRVKLFHYFM